MKNLVLHTMLCVLGSISVSMGYGQEKKLPEKFTNSYLQPEPERYNMPVHKPDKNLDSQINLALISDVKKKVVMPIYDPITSLLMNPDRKLTLAEIAKKLKEQK